MKLFILYTTIEYNNYSIRQEKEFMKYKYILLKGVKI